jgi:hypothetical protein
VFWRFSQSTKKESSRFLHFLDFNPYCPSGGFFGFFVALFWAGKQSFSSQRSFWEISRQLGLERKKPIFLVLSYCQKLFSRPSLLLKAIFLIPATETQHCNSSKQQQPALRLVPVLTIKAARHDSVIGLDCAMGDQQRREAPAAVRR